MTIKEKEGRDANKNRAVCFGICRKWVKGKFTETDSVAHGWPHTKRVRGNAKMLCRTEGGNEFLVSLAVLLHDLGRIPELKRGKYRGRDVSTYRGHSNLSLFEARDKIRELEVSGFLTHKQCAELRYIIYQHSRLPTKSSRQIINLYIVKDADMIDCFGFEGIRRAFDNAKEKKTSSLRRRIAHRLSRQSSFAKK